jgi:hypothetical protein
VTLRICGVKRNGFRRKRQRIVGRTRHKVVVVRAVVVAVHLVVMRGNIVDVKRRIVVARADRFLQVVDGVLVVVVIVVEVGFEGLGTSTAAAATSVNQRFVGVDFVDGKAALDVAVGVDLVGKRFAFAFWTRRSEICGCKVFITIYNFLRNFDASKNKFHLFKDKFIFHYEL